MENKPGYEAFMKIIEGTDAFEREIGVSAEDRDAFMKMMDEDEIEIGVSIDV